MRVVAIFAVALVAVMLVFSGCGTAQQARPRRFSVAVAITPVGTQEVSAAQVTRIHQTLRPELEAAGYLLADSTATADLVLTVAFTPTSGSLAGRIKLTSLEPTAEFRRATEGGETEESKQWRRLERELQSIVEGQGKNPDSR